MRSVSGGAAGSGRPSPAPKRRPCKVCGAGEAEYTIAARNFDRSAEPGTQWRACRSCWERDHLIARAARLPAGTPYQRAARLYVDAGWSPIPIEAGGKGRTPGGCTGYSGEIVDGDNLERWLHRAGDEFPNVALRLHRDVIDVDAYGAKKGEAQLAIAIGDWGELPPTWSSTARGAGQPSRISFYGVPPERKYKQAVRPDIETIQFHHRQAVVWPSQHHTGAVYRWYRPDGSVAEESEIPDRLELPALPESWVEALTAGERTSADRTIRVPGDPAELEKQLAELTAIYQGEYHDSGLVAAAVKPLTEPKPVPATMRW